MGAQVLVAAVHNKVFVYWLEANWRPVKVGAFDSFKCEGEERVAVSQLKEAVETVVAFPGQRPGTVNIVAVPASGKDKPSIKQLGVITAHDTHIVCLAMTPSGDKIATASQKGTIIRVF